MQPTYARQGYWPTKGPVSPVITSRLKGNELKAFRKAAKARAKEIRRTPMTAR